MSAKNMDNHNRWRNRTVAFRVSDEENAQIDLAVKLTGLTKQDYITRRLLCKDVGGTRQSESVQGTQRSAGRCTERASAY